MARCMSCHLERQLSPLPVQGSSHLGSQVCPKCSKDIDRSLGVLSIFGIEVFLPTEVAVATGEPEKPKSKQGRATT